MRRAFAILAIWAGPVLAGAEYAIRWSPIDGGPATAAKVFETLGLQSGDSTEFRIRYFDVKRPSDAPGGFEPILRERSSKGQRDVTLKYRGGSTAAPGKKKSWRCPLAMESKRKDEADVTFLNEAQTRKVFSRSCTAEVAFDAAVPAALRAKRKGCDSRMLRWESTTRELTVEEWRLESNEVVLEVSRKGDDTKADIKLFRKQVVEPLMAAGVRPLDRSKTEIGTRCTKA